MTKAQELAAFHAAMVNDERFGYSQWPERWGRDGDVIEILGHEIEAGSYDCSSSVIKAARCVGLPTGTANYTGDMREQFVAHGWLCLPYDRNALQVGDVVLNEGRHVAIYQGDGQMSEFRHNEQGGIYSGQTGDQTGDEACVARVRDFGQQWILRWPDEPLLVDGAVHRLYNPWRGRHHYTTSVSEVNAIIGLGWNYEGVAWVAPTTGSPVWRLCNPWTGEHIWTASSSEHDELMAGGWTYEGVAWKSDGPVHVWRLYNQRAGDHVWTADPSEMATLSAKGWTSEGVAFRAMA